MAIAGRRLPHHEKATRPVTFVDQVMGIRDALWPGRHVTGTEQCPTIIFHQHCLAC
jgi:hypothetical protein